MKKIFEREDQLIEMTLGDLLDRVTSVYPDVEALVYHDRPYRKTYKEFNDEVDLVARGLMAMGVEKGSHVAIWATNYPEWVVAMFATAKIGATLITVNTNYKIYEAQYLLRQSDADTLILMHGLKDTCYVDVMNELCPTLKESKPGELDSEELPRLKRVIYIDKKEDTPKGMYHWTDLYELAKEVPHEDMKKVQASIHHHDVVNMQYTSGTTGFPKGVMLTHYNILNNGKHIGDNQNFTHKDRVCIPVPFFHCFGCVLGIMAVITHGATTVGVERYNPVRVMETIQAEKCTATYGVPTMYIAILEHPDFNKYDYSSLRTGLMSGAQCPVKVMERVIDEMNMTEICIPYGMTETSPVCTMTKIDDSIEKRVATVGRAMPFVEVKVSDKVKITTWADNKKRIVFTRYFTFELDNGDFLGSAVSEWVLMNVDTRSIVRPKDCDIKYPDTSNISPPLTMPKKIFIEQEPTQVTTRIPVYSDFDYNGHVNNARYRS